MEILGVEKLRATFLQPLGTSKRLAFWGVPIATTVENVLLSRVTSFSALKRWGLEVAKRCGLERAKVAVARKHRMWIDGTTFRWTKTEAAQA